MNYECSVCSCVKMRALRGFRGLWNLNAVM
jgi:hypothetical protein